jgi:sugar (pentulose or hexulose) kinase
MDQDAPISIGIDIGTGGVRALAADAVGEVLGAAAEPFSPDVLAPQTGRHEQPAEAWWKSLCGATGALVAQLRDAGVAIRRLQAVAIDGTSGTMVPVDRVGRPLRPAMMYNDPRAVAQAEQLNELAGSFCDKLGYRFNASYALAKILFIAAEDPDVFRRAARFLHQADFAVGRLTGCWDVTDYSNALKTGYDLVEERWPDWIDQLPLVRSRLPSVVAPGRRIGVVSRAGSEETGLPEGLPVVAGATDGTAACLASGARRPGDFNTTLGTTLVFKGISRGLCRHPQGIIYCHKLPGGLWLPGAASNTGAEWIARLYPAGYPESLDTEMSSRLPSRFVAYPLARRGERFPFLSPTAEGFCEPAADDAKDLHAALLQGTAMVERLAYEVFEAAGTTLGGGVYSTGGGSRNDLWMQLRADMTGRAVHRPAAAESAFGAAILASVPGAYDGKVENAIAGMVRYSRVFEPSSAPSRRYTEVFERFRTELLRRGYL